MKDTRKAYWLMRGLEPNKTLLFVINIEIEKNEETETGGYFSRVLSLEPGTVTAWGASFDEADQAVCELFQDMVDHCLTKGTLTELLGKSEIMRKVDFSIDKVINAIETLEKGQQPRRAGVKSSRDAASSRNLNRSWLVGSGSQPAFA